VHIPIVITTINKWA